MLMDQASLTVTREKLIEAAGQVFAERGYEAATVREICSRAAVNVAAVNYHFRDKFGLYTEVLKSAVLDPHAQSLAAGITQPCDSKAALQQIVLQWFERPRETGRRSWLARIMAHEMAQPTPALDRVVEAMGPQYRRFQMLVGQLIDCSPDDARTRMCVHSVVGQILQYVQSRAMLERLCPDLDLDDEKQRQAIAAHIVKFSLAGMERIARGNRESSKRTQATRSRKRNGRQS